MELNLPRTSNLVEGWHRRFHLLMKGERPPIWRFIMVIRKEQLHTENSLSRIENEIFPTTMKKKYREVENKLNEAFNMTRRRRFRFSKVIRNITENLKY